MMVWWRRRRRLRDAEAPKLAIVERVWGSKARRVYLATPLLSLLQNRTPVRPKWLS